MKDYKIIIIYLYYNGKNYFIYYIYNIFTYFKYKNTYKY